MDTTGVRCGHCYAIGDWPVVQLKALLFERVVADSLIEAFVCHQNNEDCSVIDALEDGYHGITGVITCSVPRWMSLLIIDFS